jgi:hypothetical protein
MISSEMDHIELALHGLLDVLIKHDFILQITTLKLTYGSIASQTIKVLIHGGIDDHHLDVVWQ